MADVRLSAQVSRDLLGLAPLRIDSGFPYYLAPSQFLNGSLQWNRNQATSVFVDGAVTVQRTRQNITQSVGVEIVARSEVQLLTLKQALIEAFVQDNFILTVTHGDATYSYQAEAADYQDATWTTPRLAAFQGQVVFQVPVRPVALAGV